MSTGGEGRTSPGHRPPGSVGGHDPGVFLAASPGATTDEQDRVAAFVDAHGLPAPPAFRLLDLVSEVGELAKGAAESTDYGDRPDDVDVAEDEIGDGRFALLALADGLDVDAGEALETALAKYERRLEERGGPGSGLSPRE